MGRERNVVDEDSMAAARSAAAVEVGKGVGSRVSGAVGSSVGTIVGASVGTGVVGASVRSKDFGASVG